MTTIPLTNWQRAALESLPSDGSWTTDYIPPHYRHALMRCARLGLCERGDHTGLIPRITYRITQAGRKRLEEELS